MNRQRLDPDSRLYRIRHSLSHVLAQAVMEIRPEAKLGYGPPIENGFYYDFDLHPPLAPEDLPRLEKIMRRIIGADQRFEREDVPAEELIERLRGDGAIYKTENAEEMRDNGQKVLSVYRNGPFSDMCEGPHVTSTKELPADAFKIDSLAGAYWRGSEENKMLQRVYGLAFENKTELKEFLAKRELAKERDHRKLGAELQIFTISDEVGRGLPLWMPNGTVLRDELEKLAKETEFQWGYQRVSTPHITKEGLFLKSGHLPYYAADMFPPMEGDEGNYYLKPMNCPLHHMIYKAIPRSYRDLPLRLAEYGTCYRYEQSGELSGLLRVRAMAMNDAHIYCAEEQTREEFASVMRLHSFYYDLFGIENYWVRLSLPDLAAAGKKFVGHPDVWARAEKLVIEAMEDSGIPFEAVRGEAAFYGPKIDMQLRNVIGREETVSTNQLDLIMSERFDLTYIGKDNERHRPQIIHRAPLGTHERFVAFLIEHYGGVFPTWLAPVQVRLIPVAPAFNAYVQGLRDVLRRGFVRAEVDDSGDSFGKKIRSGATSKVPNLFIVGQKEASDSAVSWKRHGAKAQITLPFDKAREMLQKEISERIDWRRDDGEP
ncbi:MAG: threonine--tRNA ligase [SAR324 cluster bacterium]|nr:threonine--tRNA ligase [SAR324 cluster bacterium]